MNKYGLKSRISESDFKRVIKILSDSLPPIEMRSIENQKELLNEESYYLSVYREADEVKGFIASWEFDNFRFIEHFAVDESMRGKGIGGIMLKEYLNQDKRQVILEVELPENSIAQRRIDFYKKYGFKLNNYDYEQPPMQEGFEKLPLLIMSYPNELNINEFEGIRKTLYTKIYKTGIAK